MTLVPDLGAWVELAPIPDGGRSEESWLLINRRDRVSLRLTPTAADVLRNGVGNAARVQALSAELRQELEDGRFLDGAAPVRSERRWRRVRAEAARGLALMEVRTAHADRMARWAARVVAPLTGRPGIVGQLLLAALGAVAFVHLVVAGGPLMVVVAPAQVPLVLAASLGAVTIHELSHALVVVRRGGRVDYAGVRLHLGAPTFFVESVDAMLLGRRDRLIQAAAGVWSEWLITSLAAIWLWVAAPPGLYAALLARFVLVSALNITINLLPFVGLDGSWLLADAMKEPDLTQAARGALTRLVCAVLEKRPRTARDRTLAAYSLANSMIALALLAVAVLMWLAVFGGVVADLAGAGIWGWAVLSVTAAALSRPLLAAVPARLGAGGAHARTIWAAARFRAEFGWRVQATLALAAEHTELAEATETTLGAVAGALSAAPPPLSDHRTWTATVARRFGSTRIVYLDPAVLAAAS